MRFRDLPAAQIGQLGEQLAHRLLRNLGAGVIASFKFSGENDNEAPAIEFHEKRIVLPDFDVSMRGKRFWLELKTYKGPQWNRSYRCQVHGVPVRLFDQYCADEKETGTPVFLGVLEVDSGLLLVSSVPVSQLTPRYPCLCGCESEAAQCEYRSKWGSSYPQYYFRRDAFQQWHQLEGEALARLQRTHAKVAHAIRRHGPDREKSNPGPLAAVPWTWTCLPCNATGTGERSRHRCADSQQWRRDFWIQRLKWALPTMNRDDIAAIVDAPIARAELVRILGPQWAPDKDVG